MHRALDADVHNFWSWNDGAEEIDLVWHTDLMIRLWMYEDMGYNAFDWLAYLQQYCGRETLDELRKDFGEKTCCMTMTVRGCIWFDSVVRVVSYANGHPFRSRVIVYSAIIVRSCAGPSGRCTDIHIYLIRSLRNG